MNKQGMCWLLLVGAVVAWASAAGAQPRSLNDSAASRPSLSDLEVVSSSVDAWRRIEADKGPPPSAAEEAKLFSGRVPPSALQSIGTLPGEFERQQAMLLACDPLVQSLPKLFTDLVQRLNGRVQVVALVHGNAGRDKALKLLAQEEVTSAGIHFINLRHNSMWARDFGPHAVYGADGLWSLVDAEYTCPDRSADDDVPLSLARALAMPVARGDLRIDGGNLLSNGSGLLLATSALMKRNISPGVSAEAVRRKLGEYYGAREVVFLEPLAGEPTEHIDMFATFTAPDTLIIGQIDPQVDAVNAAILDRNAARLAALRSGGRGLRIVRIPMPRHSNHTWGTYTNVVYANGLVLVPVSTAIDPEGSATALAAYRELLPTWQVEPFNADPLVALGGALHCVTMNLGQIEQLPTWEDDKPRRTDHADAYGPRRTAPRFETAPSLRSLQIYRTPSGSRRG